jgi:hypothetical protein
VIWIDGSAPSKGAFDLDTTLQTIGFLIIVISLVIVIMSSATVIRVRRNARRHGIPADNVLPKRPITAYDELPKIVGLSIEADRPILLSTGAARIGNEATIVALAGLELMYYATERVAIGETAPVYLTSDTSVIPLAYDTLARAYHDNHLPVRSGLTNVRWYPAAERSLVFAAMLTVTMHSDQVTGNVLLGRFGSELGLVLGAGQRKGLHSIAGSDDIVGQAVAYVMADGPLIGEDIFSAGGYLGDRASERGGLVAQDALRVLIILGIIGVAIVEIAGDQLAVILAPLLKAFGG